ncbi:hypothetical protein ACVBEH_13135 [Roseateles sp. GG27B]
MSTIVHQPNLQSTAAILARIVAATAVLFRRKEAVIRGLEVSDSTWETWEEAIREAGQDMKCVQR